MNESQTRYLRIMNKEKVLNALMKGERCTKAELAHETGLSLGSINTILGEFIESHEVLECGFNESTGGRKSKSYEINANYSKTLCISIFRNSKRTHVVYRVYNLKNEILDEQETIKQKMSMEFLLQLIDNILDKVRFIKVIGISVPGILKNGFLMTTGIDHFVDIDIYNILTTRYSQKIVMGNDVNTAAIGLYLSQDQYENICVLYQPATSFAGIGIIVDGKLLNGFNNLAGEAQYLPLNLTHDWRTMLTYQEGQQELIAKTLQSIIAMMNPEAIGVGCFMEINFDEIISYLKGVFHNNELPKFIQIESIVDDIFVGLHYICRESMKTNLTIIKKNIL